MRESVYRFAEAMEAKLLENDAKGGWQYMPLKQLLAQALKECGELTSEIVSVDYEKDISATRVISECADVANYMMMIADNVRRRRKRNDCI